MCPSFHDNKIMSRLTKLSCYLYRVTSFKALWQKNSNSNIYRCIDSLKTAIAMRVLDHTVGAMLKEKYSNIDLSTLEPIGNNVWIFWYSGFETAPLIVKKCVKSIEKNKDINLILLDKNNFENYFDFAPHLKKLFESGDLTIQDLADILRTQLLAKHGGIWCDATVFITHNDFLPSLRNSYFYSGSYTPNWLFTKGKWTSFFIAAGKGNPLVSALSEALTYYFQFYDHHFCYFQFDYTWLYLYSHFAWAKQLIDSVNQDNKNIFYLSYNWDKPYNEAEYNKAMMENEIQKLNWKSNKVPKLNSTEETTGIHFLSRK